MTFVAKTQILLPDWAFRALAECSFDVLVERTEHEIIIMTRRGRPDLVLISHSDWQMLATAAKKQSGIDTGVAEDAGT